MKTVKVPKEYEPLFEKVQQQIEKYFKKVLYEPDHGTINIAKERYILIKATSMSIDFFEILQHLYQDEGEKKALQTAWQILYNIAHSIGKQDARFFHQTMQLTDPMDKAAAGPMYFAYTGWGFVEILPGSTPTQDENCCLIYNHITSFESDSWLNKNKNSAWPVCIMNAGYSAGWMEESFNIPLVAIEVKCKVKGDDVCQFIMAHPDKIDTHIQLLSGSQTPSSIENARFNIPDFFKSHILEKKLSDSQARYKTLFNESVDAILLIDEQSNAIIDCNNAAHKLFEKSKSQLIGQNQKALNLKQSFISAPPFPLTIKLHQHDSQLDAIITFNENKVKHVRIHTHRILLNGKNVLISIFRDINKEAENEQKLIHQINFENNIARIAKRFSKLPINKMGEGIIKSLKEIAMQFGFDRAHIFIFEPERQSYYCKYEWCAEEMRALINELQFFPPSKASNLKRAISTEQTLLVLNTEELPTSWNKEKKICRDFEIQSFICIPLIQAEKRIGLLGLASSKKKFI